MGQENPPKHTRSISGLSEETIRKGERELAHLQEMKAVMIRKLIKEQRKKIQDIWEKTCANSSVTEGKIRGYIQG